jgi:hypothetical protein
VHQAPRLPCQLNKLGKQADYSRGNRSLPTLCLVSRFRYCGRGLTGISPGVG